MRKIFSLNFLYILLIAAQVAAIIFLCLSVPAVLPLAAAYAGVWLFTFITAAVLLVRGGNSETKCAWFVVIAALPVAGAVIYLVSTSRKKRWGVLEVNGAPSSPLGKCANLACGTLEGGYDEATYFKTGVDTFKRMFAEIERAKKSVYAEFFIVGRGHIFNSFVNCLERAKYNGAEIKILIDGIGSAFKIGRKDIKRLQAAGAEVRVFHRLTPFPQARLNFRDHRKIVTVDGKVAFTGGLNLADEYANIGSRFGHWKDTAVAVYGNAASIFEGMFLAMWNGRHEMKNLEGGKNFCLPYCDSPPSRRFIEDAYAYAIASAKERVHITTPYFCVSERIAAALEWAARRGVDVKIILPHIPDKKYAFELSKATAQTLLSSGVKFYEYTPGFMHAKTVICDNKAFLGSYNFDFRSMRINYECGAAFEGLICDEAESDFLECLSVSEPLSEGRISPAKRFSRFILRLFAPLI